MRSFIPIVAVTAMLQACVMVVPPPVPLPGPAPGDLSSCHAVGLDGLIGMPVSLVPKHGAWPALRIIWPGQMSTMDYSATRLNVRVNGAGIILSMNCG